IRHVASGSDLASDVRQELLERLVVRGDRQKRISQSALLLTSAIFGGTHALARIRQRVSDCTDPPSSLLYALGTASRPRFVPSVARLALGARYPLRTWPSMTNWATRRSGRSF